jgi:drug/metabolite transporter (DMT)-like permease
MLTNQHHQSASLLKRLRGRIERMPTSGVLICLASAAAFGAMGIFGKLAYGEGATVGTLLAIRFAAAAALFWLLVVGSGALDRLRGISRRDLGIALSLGAVGYSAQAGCYFAALDRLDASLLSLLVYTFPAIVTVAAVVLGRERASSRSAGALAFVTAGLVLVLAGAASGALDPLGASLGLMAALVYAAYILTSEGVAGRLGPLVLSALVCTGAAMTLTLGAALVGDLQPADVSVAGLGWLAGMTVVSTVGAVALFFAGLARVGSTTASILSTAEPLTAVLLAFLVFGEALTAVQLAGGALVLSGVLVLTRRNTDDRAVEGEGRARGGRDSGSRTCHRGGARPRRGHGVRNRPQHALVAVGVRPARDDRGHG